MPDTTSAPSSATVVVKPLTGLSVGPYAIRFAEGGYAFGNATGMRPKGCVAATAMYPYTE